MPAYPDILLAAGVSGEVRVSYTTDSTGHVVRGSLTVERSAQELFAAAVTAVVPKWTFVPALVGGRPAAARYEEVFAFQAPAELGYARSEITTLAHDTVDGSVPRTIIGLPSRDPAATTFFSEDDLIEAQRSVLALLARTAIRPDSSHTGTITLCVALRRDGAAIPADTRTLSDLSTPGHRAVTPARCPRTYASMIYSTETRAPKGWLDPFALTITDAEGWSRDIVRVLADVSHGTVADHFRCHVARDGPTWRATCLHVSSTVS